MLKDSKGHKPSHIDISEEQWNQMKQHILDGILRKIKAVRKIQTIDKDIAAGLYVYAVEEFGKLLLFRDAPLLNGMRKITYRDEFVVHEKKIKKAFDYFRNNGFDACIVLAQGCLEASELESGEFVIDLSANQDARLSIFYSDFVYYENLPVIESPPEVEPKMLQRATEQLEIATKKLPI
jgi:hypothetical protein